MYTKADANNEQGVWLNLKLTYFGNAADLPVSISQILSLLVLSALLGNIFICSFPFAISRYGNIHACTRME